MADKVKVLVVGLGNMGVSHASAYHRNPGFEIVGLMSRSIRSKQLPGELKDYPRFEDYDEALAATKPDAVSINTWPNTHAEYAIKAINAGAHVFHGKAARHQHRGCREGGCAGQGQEHEAGAGLYSPGAPDLGEVHRARTKRSASRW